MPEPEENAMSTTQNRDGERTAQHERWLRVQAGQIPAQNERAPQRGDDAQWDRDARGVGDEESERRLARERREENGA